MKTPYECSHGFRRGACLAAACDFAAQNAERTRLSLETLRVRANSIENRARRATTHEAISTLIKHVAPRATLEAYETWAEAAALARISDSIPRETSRRYVRVVWDLVSWPWVRPT